MKHTSIRLSENHLKLIKAQGKSSTEVIKQALDAYFGVETPQVEQLKVLIHEHEKGWHGVKHEMGTSAEKFNFEVAPLESAQCAPDVPKPKKKKQLFNASRLDYLKYLGPKNQADSGSA